MSKEKFNDDCPGCRPAMMDMQTGKWLPPEHPMMQAVNRVWSMTTLEERQAFHDFCCLNSREPNVMKIVESLNFRIKVAGEAIE